MIKMPQYLLILRKNSSHRFTLLKSFKLSGKKRFKGFTFIELVIVSSVLAIVMLAIYSSFISGMRLWERSKNLSQHERKAIIGLEKFSSQLRQAIDFPSIGFNGTKNILSFPLILKEKEEGRTAEEIVKVTFEFDPGNKSLKKSIERYKDILSEGEGKKVKTEVFLVGIEDVVFAYYYFDVSRPVPWTEEWAAEAEKPIPMAVKITIKTRDGSKTATIFIPVA